jgi:hypothetical protein
MHAAVLRSAGKSPRYEQFPETVAADGEAIVRVRAASLKPIDKHLACGSHDARPRERSRIWRKRGNAISKAAGLLSFHKAAGTR